MGAFVSLAQAAKITGLQVQTLRNWIAQGKLPAFSLGDGKRKTVRIRKADVAALFKPWAPAQ